LVAKGDKSKIPTPVWGVFLCSLFDLSRNFFCSAFRLKEKLVYQAVLKSLNFSVYGPRHAARPDHPFWAV
jgi:hypothetical protein